uniref:Uncharacterized protein n=1 Tax=candidate division WOR-3 bacterium TaxID=2052148 RepID=A0A7C4X9X8_UNCW3
MGPVHLYEIKTIDGSRYRGEITYKDERMVVLKLRNRIRGSSNIGSKVYLFYNGIISIQELGWQREV